MTSLGIDPAAIAGNLESVRSKIAAARGAALRDLGCATLVAVSKTHPAEVVEAALAAGQRVFGENRVQEAEAKFPALRARHPDLRLHLIGPLQTNKVQKEAVAVCDVIETFDWPKLAEALAKRDGPAKTAISTASSRCNIGAPEPQKAGIAPDGSRRTSWRPAAVSLEAERGAGLMCIPPEGQDPDAFFHAKLAEIARQNGLLRLSMGMSALILEGGQSACGATHVRVGTAIFGARS